MITGQGIKSEIVDNKKHCYKCDAWKHVSCFYACKNMRLVCRAANMMKNAMTDRELFNWCAAILNGPVATGEK